MSLLDDITDTDVSSLQIKNELLRRTLESQGIAKAKLKKMLDLAITKSLPSGVKDETLDQMRQKRFRELEKAVDMSADQAHSAEEID